jgi:hypothetical protein
MKYVSWLIRGLVVSMLVWQAAMPVGAVNVDGHSPVVSPVLLASGGGARGLV